MSFRVCYLRENGTVDLTRGGLPVAEVNEAIRLAFNQRRAAIVDATDAVVWKKEGRRITDLRRDVK